MLAFEKASGGGHRGFIERPRIVQGAAVVERRQNRAAIDSVTIGLSLRHPARMKILPDFFGGDDAHRRWQQRVHRALNFFCSER